jgi:hypothetical protein
MLKKMPNRSAKFIPVFTKPTITIFGLALFAILPKADSMAQETSYATFEQASSDPLVIELLGQSALDRLQESYREKAAQQRISSSLSDGHNISYELGSTATEMTDCFLEQRWSSDKEQFDAEVFLLSLKKLQLMKENVSDPIIAQGIEGFIRRLKDRLNQSHVLFWLDWNLKKMGDSGTGAAVTKKIVDRDFFVVAYACKELITTENWQKYESCHKSLLKFCGVESGGRLGDDRGYASMSASAEKAAQAWYAQHRANFTTSADDNVAKFRQEFFEANIASMLYSKAKIALTKATSQAKSQFNDANNGLKYAKIRSQKALEAAKGNDLANTKSYMIDARESAVELALATSQLAETARQAATLKKYMIGTAAARTQRANIGDATLTELKEYRKIQPRGGNANVTARNTLDEMINVTETIQTIDRWLAEATEKCGNIDEALRAGEEALAKILTETASNAEAKFDVSSREAFDASMAKMSESLPTEQAIALSKAWVKILQAGIKKDPMMMAEDAKFKKFLKENFEGKTAMDIIE